MPKSKPKTVQNKVGNRISISKDSNDFLEKPVLTPQDRDDILLEILDLVRKLTENTN